MGSVVVGNKCVTNKWWEKDFLFFKQAHGDQIYEDGLAYWHHIYSVASIIEFATSQFNEVSNGTKKEMIIAALGHDALEDTKLTNEDIKEHYSESVCEFIQGLTNNVGDHDTVDYEKKIINSREEIKLLKMSDSIDNYTRQAYRAIDNGPEWLIKNIRPIMENMYQKLIKTEFLKYPKTAEFLRRRLIEAHDLSLTAAQLSK